MWNTGAHRRSGTSHFTEIVTEFLKGVRRHGTKIGIEFLKCGTGHGHKLKLNS